MIARCHKVTSLADRRPVLVLAPASSDTLTYFRRIWRNRHVMGPLCHSFLSATYHATILGAWWLVIRSLLPTLGLIAIFQHVKSLQPQTIPYPLYVISGTTLWMILALAVPKGTRCLRITRRFHLHMAFPKIMVPFASISLSLVHALIFLIVLIGGITYYYYVYGVLYLAPLWRLSLLPIILLLVVLLTTGIIAVTSILFLVARDIRMVMLFAIQIWFYFTPVAYPLDILPEVWRTAVLYANPMASLIELGRWSLLGEGTVEWPAVITSAGVCLLVFWLGMRVMVRLEPALSLVRLL